MTGKSRNSLKTEGGTSDRTNRMYKLMRQKTGKQLKVTVNLQYGTAR